MLAVGDDVIFSKSDWYAVFNLVLLLPSTKLCFIRTFFSLFILRMTDAFHSKFEMPHSPGVRQHHFAH